MHAPCTVQQTFSYHYQINGKESPAKETFNDIFKMQSTDKP